MPAIPQMKGMNEAAVPCELSPDAQAMSSILTAFVGMVVCSLTTGTTATFLTIWISWFAPFRVFVFTYYLVVSTLRGGYPRGGNHFRDFCGMRLEHPRPKSSSEMFHGMHIPSFEDSRSDAPTIWGWMGWVYTVCYSPIIQILWLCENRGRTGPLLLWAKATGVAIGVMPFTMDIRARYEECVRMKYGSQYQVIFSYLTTIALTILAVLSFTELMLAVTSGECLTYLIILYVIMSIIWTIASFGFAVPRDADCSENAFAPILNEIGLDHTIFNLILGVCGSALAAMPALMAFAMSESQPGMSLEEYLKCESVTLWQKIAACFP